MTKALGGLAMGGDNQDPFDKSLGDQHTVAGDAEVNSLGDQPTFGDANIEDDMERVDPSTRYTEEGVLGKGRFGEVTLALDTRLKRKVAIKRIQGKAARSCVAHRTRAGAGPAAQEQLKKRTFQDGRKIIGSA